jgi:hypothetical protein
MIEEFVTYAGDLREERKQKGYSRVLRVALLYFHLVAWFFERFHGFLTAPIMSTWSRLRMPR